MTIDAIYAFLAPLAACAGLDRVRHEALLAPITLRKLVDGDVLFAEGDTPDHLYLVKRGEMELVRIRDGISEPLAHLRAGDLFGEMGVISGHPRNATARAFGEAAVLCIPRETALTLARTLPAFDAALAETYIERREKNRHYIREGAPTAATIYSASREDRSDED